MDELTFPSQVRHKKDNLKKQAILDIA